MKIIIPMSGLGSRFVKAGYKNIKPLIEVQGKPIIEWVVSMFSPKDEFIFICREEHLKNTKMMETLKSIKPQSSIVSIQGHKKGPVYAVSKIFEDIENNEPVIVTYCDYYMQWNYQDFLDFVKTTECDGAVPCYTGFHPHLIPEKNLYAGCRVDNQMNLLEIKEKYSFERDKTKGYHSPGVYYFKTGKLVKEYFQKMIDADLSLNGEYYVSLVYKLMIDENKKVKVYKEVPYFCQWGTPEDLEDYLFWTELIRNYGKTTA